MIKYNHEEWPTSKSLQFFFSQVPLTTSIVCCIIFQKLMDLTDENHKSFRRKLERERDRESCMYICFRPMCVLPTPPINYHPLQTKESVTFSRDNKGH